MTKNYSKLFMISGVSNLTQNLAEQSTKIKGTAQSRRMEPETQSNRRSKNIIAIGPSIIQNPSFKA
jgi:hypothetical protein